MSVTSKTLRPIFSELKEQGWSVDQRTSGHYQAKAPGGQLVTFADSGDWRALKNTIAQLRRAGFSWPPARRERARGDERDDIEEIQRALDLEGMGFGPEPPAAPSSSAGPTLNEDQRMDQAFASLKDARAYHALAASHVAECDAAALAANRALAAAQEELRRARVQLDASKKVFDDLFLGEKE